MKKTCLVMVMLACVISAFGLTTNAPVSVLLAVDTDTVEFTPLRYHPASTNVLIESVWETYTQVYTNGLFAGGEIVTNAAAQRQVWVTNNVPQAAYWIAELSYTIPKGTEFVAGDALRLTMDRSLPISGNLILNDSQLQAVLGSETVEAIRPSAERFGVVIDGPAKTALQYAVLSALMGGFQ